MRYAPENRKKETLEWQLDLPAVYSKHQYFKCYKNMIKGCLFL